MRKLTLKLCFLSLCVALVSLFSCRGGKINGAVTLAASQVVKQFTDCDHSAKATSLSFNGKCSHVDNKIPWNECDKCGLHKVYW